MSTGLAYSESAVIRGRRRSGRAAALLSLLLLLTWAPACVAGVPHDVKQDARNALHDSRVLVRAIGSIPFHRRSVLVTGLILSGVAGLSLFDEPIRDWVHGSLSASDRRRVRGFGRALGPGKMSLGASGLYVMGLAAGHDRLRLVGRESMEAFLWTGTFTSALKAVSGRDRPYQGDGAYDFRAFRGDTSWPSGHAGSAFSVATVIAHRVDGTGWKTLTYSLAGMVAIERVLEDVHWTTDVVSGALIGYGVGRSITRRPLDPNHGMASREWELIPRSHGLALRLRF